MFHYMYVLTILIIRAFQCVFLADRLTPFLALLHTFLSVSVIMLASSGRPPHPPRCTWNSGISLELLLTIKLMAVTSWVSVSFISFQMLWHRVGSPWDSVTFRRRWGLCRDPPTHAFPMEEGHATCWALWLCVCLCVSVSVRVCVSVLVGVVTPTLGCGCQDDEELYELTRHQTAFCFCLYPGVCVSVLSCVPVSERITLVICKLISLNCNPGENYVISCMQGGGKVAASWFTTLAMEPL